jgi:hypothetical protein
MEPSRFRAHEPGEAVTTGFGPDQTVAFWIRRMAQETVIDRTDAELAARRPKLPARASNQMPPGCVEVA